MPNTTAAQGTPESLKQTFHTWGNRRGIFPPEVHVDGSGFVAQKENDCGSSYVALEVSLQKTVICILNGTGRVIIEAEVPSEPTALIAFINMHAPSVIRIGLESGPTSPWLWHSLKAAGLPVVCMDARDAPAALSVRPTKSDRNDAVASPRWLEWAGTKKFRSRALRHMREWRCSVFAGSSLI